MDELDVAFSLDRGAFRLEVAFTAPPVGVTALFGPSGCGKTTLLRCVAGLERAAGHCRVAGTVWQDDQSGCYLPAHRRPVGYVFQEASLFPHLSVRRNLMYGLRRVPAADRRVDFDEMVELLGVRGLLGRDPAGLSGGERQRVAVARALLTSPRLLLMDEPMSALDHRSKLDILPYLQRLHDTLQIPVLYVSHASDEVAAVADTIILMETGLVRETGPAAAMLTRLDLPLARDQDASAIVEGTLRSHDDARDLSRVQIPGGALLLTGRREAIGSRIRVRIHARDVSIALDEPGTSSILNILPARILDLQELDRSHVLVKLGIGSGGDIPLLARITRLSRERLNLHVQQEVFAQVKAVVVMQ
jgi:molybdate transport system ATP-binding protein